MPLLYSSSSSDSSLSLLILLDLLMQKSDFHGYVEDLEQGQIKQKKKKGEFSPLLNERINFNKLQLF